MALTDAAMQAEILVELGDPEGVITPQIATLWAIWGWTAQVANAPALQYWYTKRSCIDMLLGYYRNQVTLTVAGEETTELDQKTKHLEGIRASCESEIDLLLTYAQASRLPVVGAITALAPITPPVSPPTNPFPDANDQQYTGSPYVPPNRPW